MGRCPSHQAEHWAGHKGSRELGCAGGKAPAEVQPPWDKGWEKKHVLLPQNMQGGRDGVSQHPVAAGAEGKV